MMFNIDIIEVAILWCITGLALIGSLNSRGFFRGLLSWLVTISIAVVAIFFSYMKSVSVKQQIGFEESLIDTTKAVLKSDSNVSDNANQDPEYAAIFISIEKQLLDQAITISDSILAFPNLKSIMDKGIEQRESFESKALSLRNKSMDIYRQIRSLNPPSEEKAYYDLLLAAADNLRLAGYETHHQFGQENDVGDGLKNRAAVNAAQAKAVFLQLKEQL